MNNTKVFFRSIFLSVPLVLGSAFFNSAAAAEIKPVFDVNGDGSFDSLTDGLLALRHAFGFTGNNLISGAIGSGATRTTAVQITGYLDSHQADFDIDGNGSNEALSDGLLFLRYLFGFNGESLLSGAIGAGASRDSSGAITKHLTGACPTFYVDTPSTTRCTSRGLATYSFTGDVGDATTGTGHISISPTQACPELQSVPVSEADLTYGLSNLVIAGDCKATATMTVTINLGFISQTETRSVSIVDGFAEMQ